MDDTSDNLVTEKPDTGVEENGVPSQEATAPETAAPVTQDAQGDQPAPAVLGTKDSESLTTPISETQVPQKDWTKEGPVLEKRYSDLMSQTDRQINQWRSRMEQQGQQLQEMTSWKQEQEKRAQAASLKPWSKAHPEFQKFNNVLERAKVIDSQLRNVPTVDARGQPIPVEHQDAMKQAIIGSLSQDERNQINEYRENLNNFQKDFFTDPHGTLLPMVEQLAEQKVQQALQKIEASHSVQQDFADPQLAPLIKEYGEDFQRALTEMPQKPYEYAKQMMRLYAENQALKSGKKEVDTKSAFVEEQKRLAKGGAAITRDPSAPKQDPYTAAVDEATKKGVSLDSPRFASILAKYER